MKMLTVPKLIYKFNKPWIKIPIGMDLGETKGIGGAPDKMFIIFLKKKRKGKEMSPNRY